MRAIGAAGLAGAQGVILPTLVRTQPWIACYAAMALGTVMISAVGYHLMLFQGTALIPSIMLGVVAGCVAWGREVALPLKPRQ